MPVNQIPPTGTTCEPSAEPDTETVYVPGSVGAPQMPSSA
jgi:hypothetical protein